MVFVRLTYRKKEKKKKKMCEVKGRATPDFLGCSEIW
jgi:hypothetical protein